MDMYKRISLNTSKERLSIDPCCGILYGTLHTTFGRTAMKKEPPNTNFEWHEIMYLGFTLNKNKEPAQSSGLFVFEC